MALPGLASGGELHGQRLLVLGGDPCVEADPERLTPDQKPRQNGLCERPCFPVYPGSPSALTII